MILWGWCENKMNVMNAMIEEERIKRLIQANNAPFSGYRMNMKEREEKAIEVGDTYNEIRLHYFWSTRIGEALRRYYMMERDAKENKKKKILDLFIKSDCQNANNRLFDIMKRHIEIVDRKNADFWEYILCRNSDKVTEEYWNEYEFPDNDKQILNMYPIDCVKSLLELTEEEKIEAEGKFKKMNINGEYICISARDSAYLNSIKPDIDWSYHKYRDSEIQSFKDLATYLKGKNTMMVRMGRIVENRACLPNCVDYASDYYDELMDIYLMKNCLFFLGDCNGLSTIPWCLGTPLGLTNNFMFVEAYGGYPITNNCRTIPKKYYSREKGRLLNLKEMAEIEFEVGYDGNKYRDLGIECISNSPEEIRGLGEELYEITKEIWVETEEDKELWERFTEIRKECIKKYGLCEELIARERIGKEFLKNNRFLLD